jgi:predicted outer membrane protein
MKTTIHAIGFAAALLLASGAALAKLPPPPPMDPAAKEAADAKKKADAEKAKAELTASEERTVKNYQENMRKAGKPVPKPIPVAAQSTPPKGGEKKPQANTHKAAEKARKG